MRTTAIRRAKQLKASKLETTELLEVIEACVYSTESDPVAFAGLQASASRESHRDDGDICLQENRSRCPSLHLLEQI